MITIPEDGLDHPALAVLDEDQLLSVMVSFAEEPGADGAAVLADAVRRLHDRTDWGPLGGEVELALEAGPRCFHVALGKRNRFFRRNRPGDLRPLVRLVLELIAEKGPPIAEVVLSRLSLTGAVEAPFDPAAIPDAAGVPQWLTGLRIVQGLSEVDYRRGDERSSVVAAAVLAALSARFAGQPPVVRDRHGAAGRVDAIADADRRGYGFAIDGKSDAMLARYPSSARRREYELMQAMRDAVAASGLDPVVQWDRDGGLYVLNLWER